MGYLTLFSLLLNVWLISSTSMVVPVTLTQYTLHKALPFSITNIQDDWNDNVIILSSNNQTIRQLSKIDNKNFVPALYCDNNVARQTHQITSHYSKHQRYSHLFLANFQYRFTHSRRQLLYLNFHDIYFNYDSDYKDYIDA